MQLTVLKTGIAVSMPVGWKFFEKALLEEAEKQDKTKDEAAEYWSHASSVHVESAFIAAQEKANAICGEEVTEFLGRSGQTDAFRIRLGGHWVGIATSYVLKFRKPSP